MLDGHQSRFEVEFLKYINEPKHNCNVCIGVSYGTSLWQVGDSSQQNGHFKILLSKKKREIFEERMKTFCPHLHLMRTDIMVVVRETWPIAFGDVEKNKRAIAERGWVPLSKSLLLHPTIMNTMTETMINNELERQIFPQVYLTQLKDRQYSERNGDVKFGVNVIHGNERKLNFNGGAMASHVANSIMAEYDREEARERNKVLKQRGKSTSERIASITKKMTAGKLVVEGGCFHLNEDVLDMQ